MRNPKDSWLSI